MLKTMLIALSMLVIPIASNATQDGYIVLQEQSIKGYSVVGEQSIKKYRIIEHQYNVRGMNNERLFYSNGKFYHYEDMYGNTRR